MNKKESETMKKIQLLSIMILSGALAFGAKATAHKAQVNFQESLARVESAGSIADLMIDSEVAIHGLQFDIKFNIEEVKSITPTQIPGFEVKYNELADGLIRGLIFSMEAQTLPENITFEFLNVDPLFVPNFNTLHNESGTPTNFLA